MAIDLNISMYSCICVKNYRVCAFCYHDFFYLALCLTICLFVCTVMQLRAIDAKATRPSPQHYPDMALLLWHADLWLTQTSGAGLSLFFFFLSTICTHQIPRFLFEYYTSLLFVWPSLQVKGGASGLYDGAEVVLGPDSGLLEKPPEQQFINQKMRPGSGVLSVQVIPDGPTRVLQVHSWWCFIGWNKYYLLS